MKRRTKNLAKRALMWITTFALLLCEIPFPAAITFADEVTSVEANYVEDVESEDELIEEPAEEALEEEAPEEKEEQEEKPSFEEEDEEETTTTTAADNSGKEEVTSDDEEEPSEEETAEVDPANAGESEESSDVVISGPEGESAESVEAPVTPADEESSEEYIVDPASEETTEIESEEESSEEESLEESFEETFEEETSEEETSEAPADTIITVTYEVGSEGGGTVTPESEEITVPADEETAEGSGAVAEADEGYTFVNWTDEAGEVVGTEAAFIPTVTAEDEDSVYTANFKKAMPAAHFHQKETETGIIVIVDAPEDTFPEGTEMEVTPATVDAEVVAESLELGENEVVKKVNAVDISFYYEGEKIEPLNPIQVILKNKEIQEESKIVHVDDDGNATKVEAEIVADIKAANFESDAFSIYVIVETGEAEAAYNVVVTYTATAGGSVSKGTETISVPAGSTTVFGEGSTATPEDGYTFMGWTWTEGDEEKESSNETLVPEIKTIPGEDPITAIEFTANFAKIHTVTFNHSTEEGVEGLVTTIEVADGEKIGDQLPSVPEVAGYNTKWVIEDTETEVTADTVVEEPFTAVVDLEKIVYTVTFIQEDGTSTEVQVSIDDGYTVSEENWPEVTPVTNKIGKWVYQGTENEFPVGTVVTGNTIVEAYYEQSVYTVKFFVGGVEYDSSTVYTGKNIIEPTEPVKVGATFLGWYTEEQGQGTPYTNDGPAVDKDLNLYAYFSDQIRVHFLVKDDDGNVITDKSQYFVDITSGSPIGTMPDDPFVEGKVFEKWINEKDGSTVTADTRVSAETVGSIIFLVGLAMPHYRLLIPSASLDMNLRQCFRVITPTATNSGTACFLTPRRTQAS